MAPPLLCPASRGDGAGVSAPAGIMLGEMAPDNGAGAGVSMLELVLGEMPPDDGTGAAVEADGPPAGAAGKGAGAARWWWWWWWCRWCP